VVDARNRLAAAELERRWNEKLHEIIRGLINASINFSPLKTLGMTQF
jgi:hypothetical protein